MKSKILSIIFVLGLMAFQNNAQAQTLPDECDPTNSKFDIQGCEHAIISTYLKPQCQAIAPKSAACQDFCDDPTPTLIKVSCCLHELSTTGNTPPDLSKLLGGVKGTVGLCDIACIGTHLGIKGTCARIDLVAKYCRALCCPDPVTLNSMGSCLDGTGLSCPTYTDPKECPHMNPTPPEKKK